MWKLQQSGEVEMEDEGLVNLYDDRVVDVGCLCLGVI